MKKTTLLLFDAFVFNMVLFAYLFTVGTIKVVEGNGTSWFLPTVYLSLSGIILDSLAIILTGVVLLVVFRNKIEKNYLYAYLLATISMCFSLVAKLWISETYLDINNSVKPMAIVIFAVIFSFAYLINIYKKSSDLSNKKEVDMVFVGVSRDQYEKLNKIAHSGAIAENVDFLVELNEKVTSKAYVLVDLSEMDIKKVMSLLTFQDCRVAYLYTGAEPPKLADKQIKKWKASHDFAFFKYNEFMGFVNQF